jgi:Cu/Ag efflux protein CusF
MKKISSLIAAAVLAAATGQALAQDKSAQTAAQRGKGEAAGMRITATVESIDQATRKVTLKGPEGNLMSFVASDEVRNLAQVNKGDKVTVDYLQAIGMRLAKTDSKIRERVISEDVKRAAPGQMPGGTMTREVRVVASVEAVDAKKSSITLRGPERTLTMKVEDPKVLEGVKKGDMVEAVYLEGVSIKVEKGAK